MSEMVVGRAKGGVARAEKLTPEIRAEIARKAAQSRWNNDLPKAEYIGKLPIGDIDCAVLPDGRRVLSQRGVGRALGRRHGGYSFGSGHEDGGATLPYYLNVGVLKSFVSNDLSVVLRGPVLYRHGSAGVARGLLATALPQVCDVWLSAREAHYRGEIRLNAAQLQAAQRAEMITRGLAEVGIVALVDEVTGYQDERSRTALQEIFSSFLRRELAAWVQRFPEEFYREIFRLRGWTWKGMKVNRPQVVAYYTVDIVYSRLLPHIMEELENRMPRTESGRRRGKLHQLFSDDVGHPALAQHLYAVITLMRASDDWETFMRMLDRAHPRKTDKWLKELLQQTNEAVIPPKVPMPANDASEPLPLLALLQNAAPK